MVIANIGANLHFSYSDILEMDLEDLLFFNKKIQEVYKKNKNT